MPSKITPCLWFNFNAEEAVDYYLSIFKDGKITAITRYPETGLDLHKGLEGKVLTIAFELRGQSFTALNGGPYFQFTEAVSFQVDCATQEEIDYYWEKLTAGGPVEAQQCGWVKDKFGLSWQIVPSILPDLIASPDRAASERAMKALMGMKKLDIAELQRAFAG